MGGGNWKGIGIWCNLHILGRLFTFACFPSCRAVSTQSCCPVLRGGGGGSWRASHRWNHSPHNATESSWWGGGGGGRGKQKQKHCYMQSVSNYHADCTSGEIGLKGMIKCLRSQWWWIQIWIYLILTFLTLALFQIHLLPLSPCKCPHPPASHLQPSKKWKVLIQLLMLLMIKSSQSKRIPLVFLHGNMVINKNLVHSCGPNIFLITY